MGKINSSQMKIGALISYLLIIINALFGVFVTPFILKYLGSSSYGVYKTMGSLSSALLILDLGIGGTLMRYIANYRASSQDSKIGPFVSIVMCETGIIIPCIVLAEIFLFSQLNGMYSESFTSAELLLAKKIFVILAANIVVSVVENLFNGIISGYNDFVFGNGIKLVKLVFRILFILIIIPITKSALFLVSVNLVLGIVNTIVQIIFISRNYKIRLNFNRKEWEKGVFKESFFYTMLIFITTIAAQVNNNLDNVIIGSFCGAKSVAVYSFGLVIFAMFEQLSTAISGVALPTVSRIVVEESWQEKIVKFIIKVGRVQFILLGAVVLGFAVLGKDFLNLWLGSGYDDVYWIVLILIVPALFELCVNACLAVLRAKNMLGFRTFILLASTVLNIIVSIAGINKLGYFSAAIGTAVSFIVGSLIIMNIYYYKKLKFNMIAIYYGILNKTLVCQIAAAAVIALTSQILKGSWLPLFINVLIFVIVYGALMNLWGFSDDERQMLRNILKKVNVKRAIK